MTNLTIPELRQVVQTALDQKAPGRSPEDRAQLASAIARQLAMQALPQDGVPAAERERRIDDDLFSNVSYAIPDDELNLLPTVVRAAVDAFLKGPADALAALIGLLVRYRSLRVEISANEAAVLRVLRDAKTEGQATVTPAEIQNRLKAKGLILQEPVGNVLAGLLDKKTDKATLVHKVDERWAIGNV